MSKTGTYIYDDKLGRCIKVSDSIPSVRTSINFPDQGTGRYYDPAAQRTFYSKDEKRAYLKSNKLVENPSLESQSKVDDRCVSTVNQERKKEGLKPKTKADIIGDSRQRCK